MLRLIDFTCLNPDCSTNTFEAYAQVEPGDFTSEQVHPCEDCGEECRAGLSPVAGWAPSTDRTNAQLKKRSAAHTAKIAKTAGDGYRPPPPYGK